MLSANRISSLVHGRTGFQCRSTSADRARFQFLQVLINSLRACAVYLFLSCIALYCRARLSCLTALSQSAIASALWPPKSCGAALR